MRTLISRAAQELNKSNSADATEPAFLERTAIVPDDMPRDASASIASSAEVDKLLYKELFCFMVTQKSAESDPTGTGFKLLFACHSVEDALSWVSCINAVSGSGTGA